MSKIVKNPKTKNPAGVGLFSTLRLNAYGGLENYIASLASCLANRGVNVEINGVQSQLALSIDDQWASLQFRLLPLMTRKSTRRFASAISTAWSRSWANNATRNCRVIHYVGNGWNLLGFSLAAAAKRHGIPITCLPAVHPGKWGDSPLDIDFYKKVDRVLVLSSHEAEHLIDRGVSRKQINHVGCSTDLRPENRGRDFRDRYHLNESSIILFVGRKTRSKGYHALREALLILKSEGRLVTLVSIGSPIEPPYPILPQDMDIDLGIADESTKADAMSACDVFVLPSNEESFGIVYLEAWANVKPVICGTAPASRELIAKHEAGLACDGTPEGIARALAQLLDRPDLSRRFGLSGRQAVESEYSPNKVTEQHLSIWRSLLP